MDRLLVNNTVLIVFRIGSRGPAHVSAPTTVHVCLGGSLGGGPVVEFKHPEIISGTFSYNHTTSRNSKGRGECLAMDNSSPLHPLNAALHGVKKKGDLSTPYTRKCLD